MMSEEWPLTAPAADRPVDSAHARGSPRLASVRRDFFLDPAHRLTEQERALMTAMLHDLIATAAGEVQAALPVALGAASDPADLALRLSRSGLLDREALVSLLLRRADEHRVANVYAGRAGIRKLPLLPKLVGDSDASVAAAAMTLVVARGRRRDAFGQPRIELADLPFEEAANVAFSVAAAMASDSNGNQLALADAARTVAAAHSTSDSLDTAVAGLVDALDGAGRNDDAMAEAAAEDGEASLLAGLLAGRAAISIDTAWGYLIGGQEAGLALLARMAGLRRATAARVMAEFGALTGISVEEEIARFDGLDDGEVRSVLDWWRLPPNFRAARAALKAAHG